MFGGKRFGSFVERNGYGQIVGGIPAGSKENTNPQSV
jgi:hypothetical protein